VASNSFLEMRRRNALTIIALTREHGESSRVELARLASLSPATVSSIVEDLLLAGILHETGSRASIRGRPSVGLVFNPRARLTPGFSFTDTGINLVLCDLDGHIVSESTNNSVSTADAVKLARHLGDLLKNILRKSNTAIGKMGPIGISVPGPLHSTQGLLIANSKGGAVDYAELVTYMERHFKRKVVIDSNVNMAALAESSTGIARGASSAVVIRVGHLVRSAVIVNGKLFSGHDGLAGEIGHLIVPGSKLRCGCGNVGCVNASAASPYVLGACHEHGVKIKSIYSVAERALRGDKIAQKLVQKAGTAIGYTIAVVINTMAPGVTIISGPLLNAKELFLVPMETAIEKYAVAENLRSCIVLTSNLGIQAEALGAALTALSIDPFMTLFP
jgi:predicted NBD/HSP70 family sugar kinase